MSDTTIDYKVLYKNLKIEHEKLKKEYQENTIINSMRDMKDVYESQKLKIDKLNLIIDSIYESNRAVKVMLYTLTNNMYSTIKHQRHELKNKLEFIIDIVNESLHKKFDIYNNE